ncbi:MAG: hypothetical protein ABUR63_09555, partial [Verrucomicrobiota bacterium]
YLNLLCMSYRPAVAVAILFLVGAFGAVGLRLSSPEDVPWRRALVVMLSCLAAAGISDEPSAALWGVGLAALWLVQPNVLHARRPVGLLLLVALAAAIIVPNLAFQAALVPGGPVQNIRLIPLRSPGFVQPPLPLFTRSGGYALLMDVAPFLLILAAFVGTCLRRDRKRSDVAMTALLAALLIAATAALTAIDVNGMALESHRFMTVCEIIFPLAALVLLARLPAGHWERLPLIGALLISAVSSYHWSQYGLGDPDAWFTNDVDCRKSAGAGFFERPRPTYIPAKSLYAFAGCRAVFFPGTPNTNSWGGLLFNGYPTGGKGALELLHRQFVPPRENLQAACPVGEETKDPVCEFAKSGGRCRHAGAAFETCEITPEDRARLLTMNW